MPEGPRMCCRLVCERVGEATEAGRCPVCGFKTRPWEAEQSARMRRISGPISAPTPSEVLIVTINDISGYRIEEVHGDVFGLIVRARNAFANMGASLRTVSGGEVAGYTKLLADSRNEARERLKEEARRKGANAVVAMRFDCNAIGDIMTEVAAYGTAVTVRQLPEEAQVGSGAVRDRA